MMYTFHAWRSRRPGIVWRHVAWLLLQEYLNLIAPEDRETRWIVFRLEPKLLVPLDRWRDVGDQKHRRRCAKLRASHHLRARFYVSHGQNIPPAGHVADKRRSDDRNMTPSRRMRVRRALGPVFTTGRL